MSVDALRRSTAAVILSLLLGAAGCTRTVVPVERPAPVAISTWHATLARAAEEAQAARFASADRALSDYAARHASTSEADDVLYWRALFKLDPANSAASTRDAIVLLDGYLALSPARRHRTEAATLRRLASAMESRVAVIPAPAVVTPRPDEVAQAEEMQRLRDELARANAELVRIKRRLARP